MLNLNQSLTDLFEIYDLANEAYHNSGEALMTDAEFDQLEAYLKVQIPTDPRFQRVGATIHGAKVQLPNPMGSLEKVRPGGDLANWLAKTTAKMSVMSYKLDGLSLQLVYRRINNTQLRLYQAFTRGDGEYGQDVTKHIVHVKNIPQFITDTTINELCIRGEAVMPTDTFDNKYKNQFANARNIVAGLFNSKEPKKEILNDVRVIVYHIFNLETEKVKQLRLLFDYGFEVVPHVEMDVACLIDSNLTNLLRQAKAEEKYLIDGLVIDIDKFETVAFKTLDLEDKAIAKVKNVVWKVSKDGYLKPTINVEPIELGGVCVQHATAFNAKFVVDHGLGPDAEIVLTRSGDVIPYIIAVNKKVEPQLPPLSMGQYDWNETGVDLILVESTEELVLEKLCYFFTTLEVKGFSHGMVKRFWEAGAKTPVQVLELAYNRDHLMTVEGVAELSANKIFKTLQDTFENMTLEKLMVASGFFGRGFGNTKCELIVASHPNFISDFQFMEFEEIKNIIMNIQGFTENSATAFTLGYPLFNELVNQLKPYLKFKQVEVNMATNDLAGQVFVFTGFRSAELESKIVARGGKMGSAVSGKTTYLVCKTVDTSSSKAIKAKSLGVKVISQGELIELLS